MSFSNFSRAADPAIAARRRSSVRLPMSAGPQEVDVTSLVAHDFRGPLTSIIGYLEMLMDGEGGPLNPEQQSMLDVIKRNSRHLLALSDDLLAPSDAPSSDTRRLLDVHELVSEVGQALLPIARQLHVDFAIEVEGNTAKVLGDAVQLRRVLLNLVTNALKFTPEGGCVVVSARRVADSLCLRIVDSGIGISQEDQEQLFKPFFRSSLGLESGIEGTGLGLMITKRIVDQHDGTIEVHSVPGIGTTVEVTLPSAEFGVLSEIR